MSGKRANKHCRVLGSISAHSQPVQAHKKTLKEGRDKKQPVVQAGMWTQDDQLKSNEVPRS